MPAVTRVVYVWVPRRACWSCRWRCAGAWPASRSERCAARRGWLAPASTPAYKAPAIWCPRRSAVPVAFSNGFPKE